MLPHAPYVASSEDFALFDGKVDAPKIPTPDQDADHPFFRRWRADRSLDNDAGHYFRCMHCGAETRVRVVRPPQNCLKPQAKAE